MEGSDETAKKNKTKKELYDNIIQPDWYCITLHITTTTKQQHNLYVTTAQQRQNIMPSAIQVQSISYF